MQDQRFDAMPSWYKSLSSKSGPSGSFTVIARSFDAQASIAFIRTLRKTEIEPCIITINKDLTSIECPAAHRSPEQNEPRNAHTQRAVNITLVVTISPHQFESPAKATRNGRSMDPTSVTVAQRELCVSCYSYLRSSVRLETI